MGVLIVDTVALEEAATAAGTAAAGYEDLRASANGRLGVGAGMSGWEAEASPWGHGYDRDAAELLRGVEGLAAAYGRLRYSTQWAAALYRFAEQAAAGSAAAFEQPAPPGGERCLPLPPSAVGGRFPLLPELGQLIADAAGVSWPSGDATALRSIAGAWQDIGREIRTQAAATERAATGALAGLRGTDVLLLRDAHGELLTCASVLADGCDALAEGCNEYAGAVELAHRQLVEEATAFTRDVALTLGVSMALAPVSAGLSVWISGAAGAARLAAAASIFRSVVAVLGAASARAAAAGAATTARITAVSNRLRRVAAVTSALATRGLAKASTRTQTAVASERMAAARALARRHGDSFLGVLAAGPESLILQLAGQTAQRRLTAQLAPQLLSPVPIANPVTSVLKPGRLVPFVFSVFTAYNWVQRADSAWTLATKDSWLRQILGTGGGSALPPAPDKRSPVPRPDPTSPGPSPPPKSSPSPRPGPSPQPVASPSPRPGPSPQPVASPEPRPRPSPQPGPSPLPSPSSSPHPARGPGPDSGRKATTDPKDPLRPPVGSTTRPYPEPVPAPPQRTAPPGFGLQHTVSRRPGEERPGQGSRWTCPTPTSSPDHRKDGSTGSR
ncbi:hypothetical protein E4J89_09110 [Arthrobacter sp. CAU 1506]|uniref:WXG100-like domain-containing protein n=1 Tax=Arthrobacter sp. CAU 1506 TaxID=2560052 RepID=UPI0010AC9D90|nr:hypothetical protein [Arthrobacter sp. CAU 1506]TJY69848.1 hypothetical protein E4J89_09110 [Arthrobacter sp. CAU 1506]